VAAAATDPSVENSLADLLQPHDSRYSSIAACLRDLKTAREDHNREIAIPVQAPRNRGIERQVSNLACVCLSRAGTRGFMLGPAYNSNNSSMQ
jgi:hypothetical protein